MTRSRLLSCLIASVSAAMALSVVAAEAPLGGSSTTEARILYPECLVRLIDRDGDVQVPAQEAGVLLGLEVREGTNIESGAMIGQIDDNLPQMKKKVADAEYAVAKAEAENNVDIEYNEASAQVKAKEYQLNVDANKKNEKTKPITEIERLWLEWKKASLGIKQAQVKQGTDKLKADAKAAEVNAAENEIQRRKITAPISGEVIEIYAGVGEWLSPGAPVVRLARLDKLRIEGRLQVKEFAPSQVSGRTVKVAAHVGPDRVEEFQGKVVFVDPLITAGKYKVVAEIINRRDSGDGPWLLRPGMQPEEMIIDAIPGSHPGAAAHRPAAAPR